MNILIDGQTLETPDIHRGIGIYFKNVLNNMVKQSFQHNWYITLSNEEAIKHLDSWAAQRMTIIIPDDFRPGMDFERTKAYTECLLEVICQYEIDVLWLPNPLMVNVVFPDKKLPCEVYTTIYDLIPLVMPIDEWNDTIKEDYRRRLDIIKKEDYHLLCISEATKKDFVQHVGTNSDMRVTFLAADTRLFYKPRKKAGLSSTPNIVFTGGVNFRKNLDGAIESLKVAKEKYKGSILEDIKFYIICHCDENTRKLYGEKLKKMNLEENVIFTGFVSNQELADYYGNADVFFFPSLYEGFGLPIIEAMLGGAYIVSGDNSSLPEVCGGYALLGDSGNVNEMADLLFQAFENVQKESLENKLERQNYAYGFSWENTAKETLKAFEDSKNSEKVTGGRNKIAIVIPWQNQTEGIADYIHKLIPYLEMYYIVDVFADIEPSPDNLSRESVYKKVFSIDTLEEKKDNYYRIIYHVDNNESFSVKLAEYMLKYPGIVEIHNEPEQKLIDFPHAKAVICHNHWSKDKVKKEKGVYIIPYASFRKKESLQERKNLIIKDFKKKYNIQDELIITCLGLTDKNKRTERVFQTIASLQNEKVKIRWFCNGDADLLSCFIKDRGFTQDVFVLNNLKNEEYEIYLEMTDIIVNVNPPSMDGSSKILSEIFQWKKPVVVSQIGQYREYPDEVCWKVPVGQYEAPVMKKMLSYLIEHEDVRTVLGKNAKAYADEVLSCEKISRMYQNVIE